VSEHRFYVPPKQIIDDNVFIRGMDVWHITKVLRLSKGSHVVVFDGTGREYRVVLGKQKPREILGTVVAQWARQAESPLKITLIQGVPKANKMDVIVQKATEVGVNDIIPLFTERSVWSTKQQRPEDDQKINERLDRWARISVEAAKQCCRSAVPRIYSMLSIAELGALKLTADVKLLLWEDEQKIQLRQFLRDQTLPVRSAMLVIGPEGGLTEAEAEAFRAQGYQSISLGQRILRTETAGLVVAGILQYEFGDY